MAKKYVPVNNDINVGNGATVNGTKDNDIFHITATTGNATIAASNQATDTLWFDIPIENSIQFARHVEGTKDLAIDYIYGGNVKIL